METVLPLVCLLLGSSLTVAGLAFLVRRAVRQLSVASAYREAALHLGLSVDTRGVSVRGYLGDRRIWIGEVLERVGGDRTIEVRGVVGFLWPLGLGLCVVRRGARDRVLRRPKGRNVPTGSRLEGVLDVHADDPDLAVGLFSPRAATALEGLVKRWPGLSVSDTEIAIRLREPEATSGALRDLVAALTEAAEALEEARSTLPPPQALSEGLPAWEAAATTLALNLGRALPALVGDFEGYKVHFSAHRLGEAYAATLTLWFQAHNDLGLLLRPQVEPDGYWSVGQDIQVGDRAFDAAFVIKGYDPGGVRSRLNSAVRSSLMRLASRGRVVVDDRALIVGGLPPDPAILHPLLDDAVAAAKGLGW